MTAVERCEQIGFDLDVEPGASRLLAPTTEQGGLIGMVEEFDDGRGKRFRAARGYDQARRAVVDQAA